MPDPIATAILKTIVYADLFDYALTPEEVHCFLIGVRAPRDEIERTLYDPARLDGSILRLNGFIALPRRNAAVASRLRWRGEAQRQWRRARFYARLIAHFPFVRMIAVSGGLAMDNARDNDIDFLIVTTPGRLWFVRGLVVALVRLARWRGDNLCPNFLITENALTMPEQNLYTAHEIFQMVPLYGLDVFQRMRELNAWASSFLPNADGSSSSPEEIRPSRAGAFLKGAAERVLGRRIGNRIERWEMKRKIAKFSAQIPPNADSVIFSEDVCRGFFSGHGKRVLKEFYTRIEAAGL